MQNASLTSIHERILAANTMIVGPGVRFGSYEILSALGAGGMGEVYRARDTNLGREVALKIVRPLFREDPEHLERFRREAHVLATLNHPHIATVHDLDESGGVAFLVMELVEGETLHDRLRAGPLTVAEAVRTCAQVAAALEAAHERGIIHRDLKPANIKITPDGAAKVLDFGLAKALAGDTSRVELSQSPTAHVSHVSQGLILGTISYMSPEQARGKALDRRTDIWSFGCVLFESLTGRAPFPGETTSDIIAAVLDREPEWRGLPADTPATVRRLLRRCLEKDPGRRQRDIGDARLDLEEAAAGPTAQVESSSSSPGRSWLKGLVPATAAVIVGALLGGLLLSTVAPRSRAAVEAPARFLVALPNGEELAGVDFPALALSPDGSRLAYVGTRGGRPQLFVRRLDALESTPIPGSADAIAPFFSSDSRWIAFFADGKLKKAAVGGGAPSIICDASIGFGGTWGADDLIVFAPATGSGLSQVMAAGGQPTRLTTLDTSKGEFSHRWPAFLPDGKTVLFTVGTVGSWDDAQIVAQSMASGQRTVLVQGGTHPQYAPSGHLLYARGGSIMAVPFDAVHVRITGQPIRVADGVVQSSDGAAQVAVSQSGSILYFAGSVDALQRRLIAVDRSGGVTPLAAPPAAYASPRVSPDGRQVAVTIATEASEDLWLYDISQGSVKQLTFETNNASPTWTPDGESLTFSSSKTGAANLFSIHLADHTQERLASSENVQVPGSWSPDGQRLAFVERHPTTGRDIWMLPRTGNRAPQAFLASPSDESAPRFSPEGKTIAYVSNESGRNEVYVRGTDGASRPVRVSSGGGTEPVWSRTGQELFYRSGDRMMAASIASRPEPRVTDPRVLFEARFEKGTTDSANYDVGSDQRFIMIKGPEDKSEQHQLHILLHWLPAATAPR